MYLQQGERIVIFTAIAKRKRKILVTCIDLSINREIKIGVTTRSKDGRNLTTRGTAHYCNGWCESLACTIKYVIFLKYVYPRSSLRGLTDRNDNFTRHGTECTRNKIKSSCARLWTLGKHRWTWTARVRETMLNTFPRLYRVSHRYLHRAISPVLLEVIKSCFFIFYEHPWAKTILLLIVW